MCADLGHENHFFSAAAERFAHPLFALAVVILPGVIEEIDAVIERVSYDLIGFILGLCGAQVKASQADDRDIKIGLSELPPWNYSVLHTQSIHRYLAEGNASPVFCVA